MSGECVLSVCSVTVYGMTTLRTRCASVAWTIDFLSIMFALGHFAVGIVDRVHTASAMSGRSYELLETSAGRPAAWDCRTTIDIVANFDEVPVADRDGIETDLLGAISDVNANGPFAMRLVGHTHVVPSYDWPHERDRVPGRPAVIVHVARSSTFAADKEKVAATGGSFSHPAPGPFDEAHAGHVWVDRDDLGDYLPGSGWMSRQALFTHELLHVLGLGHVHDADSVLTPRISESNGHIGRGDRAGLEYLAAGRCTTASERVSSEE